MWPRVPRAVRLTHHETGIEATVESTSLPWHKMIANAKRILAARVWAAKNGMNKERIKTYHQSPMGTWTKDHRTGERVDGLFLGEQREYR